MPFRERLKKTFRRSSSIAEPKIYDPSDRTCSLYYQPGEKIPYKYRRPVEPEHKAHLDSFQFPKAWKRRSNASQYSPMGSRMPSRNNSASGHYDPFDGVRISMGSLNGSRRGSTASAASHSMHRHGHHHDHEFDPNHLETIQSVQTSSRDEHDSSSTTSDLKKLSSDRLFSINELNQALQRAEIDRPASPRS
jgi:hypothetical protein